jgi:hypothetical protein
MKSITYEAAFVAGFSLGTLWEQSLMIPKDFAMSPG